MRLNTLLSLIIFAFFLNSCSVFQSGKKLVTNQLPGKWIVSYIDFVSPEISDVSNKKNVNQLFVDSYLSFHENGTVTSCFSPKSEQGNWSLINKGKQIEFTFKSVQTVATIKKICSTELTLEVTIDGAIITLVFLKS